jgi:hypothetical protein
MLSLAVQQQAAAQDLVVTAYNHPYYGVTIQHPSDWYTKIDPTNYHASPWHLPIIPIKELQPSAIDLLIEGRKTLVIDLETRHPPGQEFLSKRQALAPLPLILLICT